MTDQATFPAVLPAKPAPLTNATSPLASPNPQVRAAWKSSLYFMRRNRRARVVAQSLVQWAEGLTVTSGDYVQNIGNVYQAVTAGTSGATAPTQQQGQQSDGNVARQFVDMSLMSEFIFNAPPQPAT